MGARHPQGYTGGMEKRGVQVEGSGGDAILYAKALPHQPAIGGSRQGGRRGGTAPPRNPDFDMDF